MGTWGVAIFSDDLACDVRDEYRELVADGLSGADATEQPLQEYQEVLGDMDDSPVFWLALAVTQWRCGRLEEEVKAKALEVIERGVDLARWSENPGLLLKRKAVLEKAKLQITSPQPLPKKIRKQYKQQTPFNVGDAFAYQLASGNYVIFRVVDLHVDKGGVAPCVELCDWLGKSLPPGGKIQTLKA